MDKIVTVIAVICTAHGAWNALAIVMKPDRQVIATQDWDRVQAVAVAARADYENNLVLAGDPTGIYGAYPPATMPITQES